MFDVFDATSQIIFELINTTISTVKNITTTNAFFNTFVSNKIYNRILIFFLMNRSYTTFKDISSILATIGYFAKYITGCAHKLAKVRAIIHPFAKTSKIDWDEFGHLEALLNEVICEVNNAPALFLLSLVRKQEDIERLGIWHDSSKRALGYIQLLR